MKKLSVLFAAMCILVSGQAVAFDRSDETSAQVYFSIPFGGPTKAEATPRLGISAGVGRDNVGYTGHDDDFGIYSPTSALGGDPFTVAHQSFDFRLGVDGATSLYLNGANVDDRLKTLNMSQEELEEGWLIPLSMIGLGIIGFVAIKSFN